MSPVARRRGLALLAAFGTVAAACGGTSTIESVVVDNVRLEATGDAVAAPSEAIDGSADVASSTSTPAPVPDPTPTPVDFDLDPSLLGDRETGTDDEVAGDTTTATVPVPARPAAPSLPAGTIPPTPSSTGGGRWTYTALLGSLSPDDQVVAPVIAPPSTEPGTSPLTGLPGSAALGRAVIVKIDNTNNARPHAGILEADIVYEEMVESGVTRLAAVYHSTAAGTVGPVRSGRSTDIGIIDSFAEPVFSNSGANSIFDGLLDKQPIVNRGAEQYGGYWRNNGRVAPHNLFTSTSTLLDGVGASTPPAQFAYRADGEPVPDDASPASLVSLTYSSGSYAIGYEWDAGVGGWRRWQSGWAHSDTAGRQVAPENLVVQFVDYVDTGMSDKFGAVIIEGTLVGTGPALVFTDGHVIEATWTRSSLRTPTTFTDASGAHVELTPGRTWVALVPPGGAVWS